MPPKTIKPLNPKNPTYKQPLQHDVEKAQSRDKIRPKDIFEQMDVQKKSKKKKNNKRSKY
jgi:hypothetical protein